MITNHSMNFIDLLTHSERNFIQASKSDNFLPVANKNKHDETENQSKSNVIVVVSFFGNKRNTQRMSIKFHSKKVENMLTLQCYLSKRVTSLITHEK